MDEDGFYEGELMDGRRGLVPSNFIQPLSGSELVDFTTALSAAATFNQQQSQQPSTSSHLVDSLFRPVVASSSASLLRSTTAYDPSSSTLPVFNCLSSSEETSDRFTYSSKAI